MFIIGRSLPLGEKGSYKFATVTRSLKRSVRPFSLKTTHWIFLKLLMKLQCLKGKKLMKLHFFGKILLEIMPKNTPKIRILKFCKII